MSLWFIITGANAAPAPRALPPATEARLRAILDAPELRDAYVGLEVLALGTAEPHAFPARAYDDKAQPVLLAVDAGKRFLPASNMKLFTAALALKVLGPERTFPTRVMQCPIPLGKIRLEPLYLVGGGDPAFATDDLNGLAQAVVQRGIRRVAGIRADATAFSAETFGGRYPDGWTLDDTIWYYGPEISALAFNRNQVDIVVTGEAQPSPVAKVRLEPASPGFRLSYEVHASVSTGGPELVGKASSELLSFGRSQAVETIGDTLHITGQVAPNQTITEGVAVPHPPRWAAQDFAQMLRDAGVAVAGIVGQSGAVEGFCPDAQEIARHDSPPLRVLLRRFLKNSDNLYAEMLLRDAAVYSAKAQAAPGGNASSQTPGAGIASSGQAAVAHRMLLDWLRQSGVPTEGLRLSDGSGLSRYNLITPDATARLLAAIERLPGGDAIWDALPIAGRDGTLKSRMQGTPAQDNARAKTGTFSIVSCLSGYVTTRDGQRLAVALLTNFARDGNVARRAQDQVFATLAEASWQKP